MATMGCGRGHQWIVPDNLQTGSEQWSQYARCLECDAKERERQRDLADMGAVVKAAVLEALREFYGKEKASDEETRHG